MELGILRKQKRSVHIPSRCKTTKTPPPCAFEVHHTYTYGYLRISIYVPRNFSSTLTYSLPTYRQSLPTNQRYIYLPQIKFYPNPSNPVPTYLVHSTNHLTFSYRPSYLPVLYTLPIYTGVGGVRRQVVYQTVTATLDFDKGYDSS